MTSRANTEAPALEYSYSTFEGEERDVLVGVESRDQAEIWSVYDVPAGDGHEAGWLVEHLTGPDEKLEAAAGVARAYWESQVAFQSEGREFCPMDPLPKPTEVPIAEIREHVDLAREIASPASPAGETTAIAA
jgi:hypothetical protein